MQNIAPFPLVASVAPTAKTAETGKPEETAGLFSAGTFQTGLGEEHSTAKELEDFQQLFQTSKLQQEGLGGENLTLEEGQLQMPGLPPGYEGRDLPDFVAGGPQTLVLPQIRTIDTEEIGKGLSAQIATLGEGLPPGLPPDAQGEIAFTGLRTGQSNLPVSEPLAPVQGLIDNAGPKLGSSPLSDLTGATANIESEKSLNEGVLRQSILSAGSVSTVVSPPENSTKVIVDSQVKTKLADSQSKLGLSTRAVDSAAVKVEGSALVPSEHSLETVSSKTSWALLPKSESSDYGVKSNAFSGQVENVAMPMEPVLRTQAHADYSNLKLSMPELPDMPEVDRHERPSPIPAEFRSRVQGEGLRQYATGIGVNVSDPNWGEQMSQKIVWLSGRNIQSAEIQLHPAELGPIDVKISVQNDQASIIFNAQHASVRELLEGNIHRLREMMGENGVELSDVNVASEGKENPHSAQDSETQDEGSNSPNQNADNTNFLDSELEQNIVTITSPNIVDFYA